MAKSRTIPVAVLEKQLAEVGDELASLEARREALEQKEEFYREILGMAVSVNGRHPKGRRRGRKRAATPVQGRKPGPSDAILNLLRQEPGLTSAEIVSRLELAELDTRATDIVKTLQETVRNLRKNGKINLVNRGGKEGFVLPETG